MPCLLPSSDFTWALPVTPPAERYARRAKSALYASDSSERVLHPWEAFQEAAAYRAEAAEAWLTRLRSLIPARVQAAVESVPETHMSAAAKHFACALLDCNAKLLGDQ